MPSWSSERRGHGLMVVVSPLSSARSSQPRTEADPFLILRIVKALVAYLALSVSSTLCSIHHNPVYDVLLSAKYIMVTLIAVHDASEIEYWPFEKEARK